MNGMPRTAACLLVIAALAKRFLGTASVEMPSVFLRDCVRFDLTYRLFEISDLLLQHGSFLQL